MQCYIGDYINMQSVEWLVYGLNDRRVRVPIPVKAVVFSVLYRTIMALEPILPPI
jgi:hypothetical protein